MNIKRVERKYLLDHNQAVALKRHLDWFLDQSRPHGYEVWSQYFDTFEGDFLRAKLEGEYKHIKVRYREYLSTCGNRSFFDGNPCGYLEIKCKDDQWQVKWRQQIYNFSNEQVNKHLLEFCKFDPNLAPWILRPMVPACGVRFHRTAWIMKEYPIRITLDDQISVTENQSIQPLIFVGPSTIKKYILEVKTPLKEDPLELRDMIHKFELKQISFSKYGEAMAIYNNEFGTKGADLELGTISTMDTLTR